MTTVNLPTDLPETAPCTCQTCSRVPPRRDRNDHRQRLDRLRDLLWSITPVVTTKGKRAEREERKYKEGFDSGRLYDRLGALARKALEGGTQ